MGKARVMAVQNGYRIAPLVFLGLVEDGREARRHLPLQPPQLLGGHLGHAGVPDHLQGPNSTGNMLVSDTSPYHILVFIFLGEDGGRG